MAEEDGMELMAPVSLRPCEPALETLRPDELAARFRDLERQLLLKWDAPLAAQALAP